MFLIDRVSSQQEEIVTLNNEFSPNLINSDDKSNDFIEWKHAQKYWNKHNFVIHTYMCLYTLVYTYICLYECIPHLNVDVILNFNFCCTSIDLCNTFASFTKVYFSEMYDENEYLFYYYHADYLKFYMLSQCVSDPFEYWI